MTSSGEHQAPATRRVGPRALLVEVADHHEARALASWIRTQSVSLTDVVPAARTVLLDGLDDPARVSQLVGGWRPGVAERPHGRSVRIPVRYDGPDLAVVARSWGVTEDEVVRRHTGLELVSAFVGFAPGFSYLGGLPEEWSVPRLDSPRSRVPAGAVAIADRWCAVYPGESPGGWLLLGRTGVTVWDLSRAAEPSLLPPGTRVRFVAA
ncbi:allophanate hydrolase subunit 1 [Nocardioides sp. 616]|uniref:5-oxoprolinase subunit B family protein n=1 Tax=Nocardioides sp. 616 TaxID=2268090 RepID=UPI000CE4D829|nr:allophanate hydrolase subunit 1 [Nocardioides sp. 616]